MPKFQNVKNADEEIDSLLERLLELYKERADSNANEAELNQKGDALYFEVIDKIIALLQEVAKENSHLAANSSLLREVNDEGWQISFKTNFHKLFIDLHRLNETDNHRKFNRYKDTDGKQDQCYCESFAIAFLFMLKQVKKYLNKDDSALRADALQAEFLKIICDINAILNVSLSDEEITTDYEIICPGIVLSYDDWLNMRQRFGDEVEMFFCQYGSANIFPEDYPHQRVIKGLVESFLKNNSSTTSQEELLKNIFNLTNQIACELHAFCDANGRTGILTGWFFSLLLSKFGTPFPTAWNQYCYFDEMLEWSKIWNDAFWQHPDISPSFNLEYQELLKEKSIEFYNGNMVLGFLSTILTIKENCFLSSEIDCLKPIVVKEEECLGIVIGNNLGEGEALLLNPSSILQKVIAEKSEEIKEAQATNGNHILQKTLIIAEAYLGKLTRLPKESLELEMPLLRPLYSFCCQYDVKSKIAKQYLNFLEEKILKAQESPSSIAKEPQTASQPSQVGVAQITDL